MSEVAILQNGLPAFSGGSFEQHVEAFERIRDEAEDKLWTLGAIAESLTRSYGDKAIPDFAAAVNYSASRIYELAATYKAWSGRDRAEDLSFTHHAIAARSEDPEGAIVRALGDSELTRSTRKFAAVVKAEDEPEGVVEVETRRCPTCEGEGRIPVDREP
jgi:hypothetical protein